MRNLVDQRIEYVKDGGNRYGWKGTITSESGTRVMVAFDNGVDQDYSVNAVMNEYQSKKAHERNEFETAYLALIDDEGPEGTLFFIRGERGGSPKPFRGSEADAIQQTKVMAAKSKSGQPYLLFKPVIKCERETTPVKVTELS